MIGALDGLYGWVVGHRILAGALLLLGSINLFNTLTNPMLAAAWSLGLVDVTRLEWLARARVAFHLVAVMSLWLICAGFLLRSWRAYRAEGLRADAAGRPGFFFKRGAALLFLGYFGFAVLGGDILPFFLFQPPEEVGWYLLISFGTAGLIVAGIALLALIAQRAQAAAQRDEPQGTA